MSLPDNLIFTTADQRAQRRNGTQLNKGERQTKLYDRREHPLYLEPIDMSARPSPNQPQQHDDPLMAGSIPG